MKYQCEGCDRLVKVETYVLEDHALAVACPACGAWTRAAPPISKPASPRPTPTPEGEGVEDLAVAVPLTAPYAGPPPPPPSRPSVTALRVVRPDAPAAAPLVLDGDLFQAPPGHCPKCVAPMRDDAGSCSACGLVYANFIPDEHQPSEVLAGEWRELLETWHDWDAHDRLLSQGMVRGEMAMVGRLYRMRLARAPNDAQALRGRDEVVRRVTMATTLASDGPSPALGRKVKTVVMGVVLVVSLVMLLVLVQMMRGSF
ncbi:hypothetical protein COCOR_07298 [Corallococcus coralloides DSM 2259]|uniref:Uncharacterized protein n=1 Tax=Corallococcus coralloides (strain ATCC 25202 / DSM 2259 / NBRC 100086 / M2) TaxID=1144275 RepID=H8ML65_CORCM|nr:hypothetical protein [Corallococcus coralloides]AFE07449.1 hypothetical protein COCOR_07298 [Corallococcus coralloides DSM 2259]